MFGGFIFSYAKWFNELPHLVHLPRKNPQGFLQQLQQVSQFNYECN